MRLHVLSDLHLEHEPFTPVAADADVVVLAGDTAPGVAGVRWARSAFPADRPVVYVPGNHEFYGHEFPALVEEMRAAAAGSQVQILERDEVTIDGVRFLGCTLWTDFGTAGADRRAGTMRFAERVVNDYKLIRSSDTHLPLRPAETYACHRQSREWLTRRLSPDSAAPVPTVVVTHHVPLVRRRTDNLALQALAGSIVSDLGELIGVDRQVLWVHGHSHRPSDTEHAGTRVLSNPRGYRHERLEGFNPSLVVDV